MGKEKILDGVVRSIKPSNQKYITRWHSTNNAMDVDGIYREGLKAYTQLGGEPAAWTSANNSWPGKYHIQFRIPKEEYVKMDRHTSNPNFPDQLKVGGDYHKYLDNATQYDLGYITGKRKRSDFYKRPDPTWVIGKGGAGDFFKQPLSETWISKICNDNNDCYDPKEWYDRRHPTELQPMRGFRESSDEYKRFYGMVDSLVQHGVPERIASSEQGYIPFVMNMNPEVREQRLFENQRVREQVKNHNKNWRDDFTEDEKQAYFQKFRDFVEPYTEDIKRIRETPSIMERLPKEADDDIVQNGHGIMGVLNIYDKYGL